MYRPELISAFPDLAEAPIPEASDNPMRTAPPVAPNRFQQAAINRQASIDEEAATALAEHWRGDREMFTDAVGDAFRDRLYSDTAFFEQVQNAMKSGDAVEFMRLFENEVDGYLLNEARARVK